MTQPLARRSRLRNTSPGFQASRRLRASGDAGWFGPAGEIGLAATVRFSGSWLQSISTGETDGSVGFLKTSWFGKEADGSRATSAPRPARITLHPPLRQCSSLAAGESRALHGTVNGAWRCLMASRGSRDHATIFQHPSASIQISKAIRLTNHWYQVQWHPGALEPCRCLMADRPTTRQQATPLPPAPSASRSGRWLSQLRNHEDV